MSLTLPGFITSGSAIHVTGYWTMQNTSNGLIPRLRARSLFCGSLQYLGQENLHWHHLCLFISFVFDLMRHSISFSTIRIVIKQPQSVPGGVFSINFTLTHDKQECLLIQSWKALLLIVEEGEQNPSRLFGR